MWVNVFRTSESPAIVVGVLGIIHGSFWSAWTREMGHGPEVPS
jgi:hypothetical protein